jgi:hypothetical protein
LELLRSIWVKALSNHFKQNSFASFEKKDFGIITPLFQSSSADCSNSLKHQDTQWGGPSKPQNLKEAGGAQVFFPNY